jgi:hypothetical protein
MKAIALLAACLAFGCTTRKAALPDGRVLYQSTRFGNKEAIKRVEFRSAAGDVFVLEGYASDQVEAIGVAVEAAARGAVGALVPSAGVTRAGPPSVPAGFKLVPKDDPSRAVPEIIPHRSNVQ